MSGYEVVRVGDGHGPRVTVLGGVHGDEIEGVLAARALLGMLPAAEVRGQVTVVPVAHPAAYELGTRCGADGGNLARAFPGSPDGTPTERLAWSLTQEVIAGADFLIDMHSAGFHYRMPGFCGYPAYLSYAGLSCRELAMRTGFPIVWGHQQIQPGRSISAAQDLGIPWIYFESGGGGALRRSELDDSARGALAILAAIGVVNGEPAAAGDLLHVTEGDGDVDAGLAFTARGLFIAHVQAGDVIAAGAVAGEVVTPEGEHAEWIRAPYPGRVMMIRHTCKVEPGDLALLVAPAGRE